MDASRVTADLLTIAVPGAYTPFVELPLRIPVARLDVAGTRAEKPKVFHEMDERATFLRDAHRGGARPIAPEIQYTREQLADYQVQGKDTVYETACLVAKREGKDAPAARVHVFDMYWTDISRVSTAGMRMFGELYQLLFYVCGLGRKTIDFALAEHASHRTLRALAFFQKWAERDLVLFIPILNMCALGLTVVLVPQKIYDMDSPLLVQLATAGLLAVVVLGAALAARAGRPSRWWPWWYWIALAACTIAAWKVPPLVPSWMPLILTLMCWILVAAAIVALMYVYDRRRPGALGLSVVAVAAVGLMLLCPSITKSIDERNVQELGLRAGHWLYVGLHWLWVAFIVLAAFASLAGFFAALQFKRGSSEAMKASRAIWTANLSLVLPGLLTLLLNLALWWGCFHLGAGFLGADARDRVEKLLEESTPWSFVALLALAGLAVFSVVWGVMPSILAEKFPRWAAGKPAQPLGHELTEAFASMRTAGEIIRAIFVVLLPASYVVLLWIPPDTNLLVDSIAELSRTSTLWIGLALVAMVAGPGPFRALGLGMRTSIDVAIDVANWLRLYPRNNNPRARICARYASLLNHVLDYRDPVDGRAFDAIIVFAHSQGTVISAELLRFLKSDSQPLSARLQGLPVQLFTMGCPLRQLYGQRFPHQYAWARHEAHTWPGDRPDPTELDVATWVNAYRSGDYIGRYLWHPDGDDAAWDPQLRRKGPHAEFCLGAGAHMHYWDDSALPIGAALDELIRT